MTAHGLGSTEKNSRKKLRAKRARFCSGSGVKAGSAFACLPASSWAASRM